jgi:phospholipase/carboxylesterase
MVSIDASAVRWSAPDAEREGRPLVLLLHGLGSHEGDLIGLAPYLSPDFVYASLRAPLPYGGPGGWSWYPLSSPGAPDYAAVDEAADAVLAHLDDLRGAYPSVGLLGFSQGGSLALQLLRRRPEFFDFAVVLAGFVTPGAPSGVDEAVAGARPRVFYGRGDADPVIPVEAVERTSAWVAAHAEATENVYPGLTHSISQEELDDVNGFLAQVHPA